MAQAMYRAIQRVRSRFILTMAARHPARSLRLLALYSGETCQAQMPNAPGRMEIARPRPDDITDFRL